MVKAWKLVIGQTTRAPSARYVTIVAVCVILFLSIMAKPTIAVEPNDTLATASATGLVGTGQVTITDAIVGDGTFPERDVDIYSLEIAPTIPMPIHLTATVTATGPELDSYLRLFDASGAQLAANDDVAPEDTSAHVTTYLFTAGTYYLGVSTSGNAFYDNATADSGMPGSTGSYELTVTTSPAILSPSPFEPNDHTATATPVGSDSFTISGEFIGDGAHGRRDVDIYALEVGAAARIDVEVAAESIGSTLDPVVRMRTCTAIIPEKTWDDPCGLGSNDDRGDGSRDAKLSVGVTSAATTVYIMVSGSGNRRFDPTRAGSGEVGSVGAYELHAMVTYFSDSGIREPNDSISSSYLIHDGRPQTVSITAAIGDGPYARTRGDRDFYTVQTFAESRIFTATVTPDSGSGLIPVLALYDRAGTLLSYADNHHHSQELELAFPALCTDRGNTYYPEVFHVMVMGAGQRPPNDPFVPWPEEHRFEEHRVGEGTGSQGAYRLTIRTFQEDECGTEPNDTLDTASPSSIVDEGLYVCTNGFLGDSLCPGEPDNDADVWSFEVTTAPALLEVGLCVESRDAVVRLFDSAGQSIPFDSRAGKTSHRLLTEPGTYFAAVTRTYYGFDPFESCSSDPGYAEFDLSIRLTRSTHRFSTDESAGVNRRATDITPWLFSAGIDAEFNVIAAIDPATGEVAAHIDAPERHLGGTGGMAYDGANLFVVGSGRYPKLYQLDGITGEVLNDYVLWQGSGWYSDAVTLGDELYLLDFYDRAIHVIDPVAARFLRSMPVHSATRRPPIGGGLAALAGPNRLYVADAFDTGDIYEVSPQTGAINATLPALTRRPTALAGIGDWLLYAADWLAGTAEIITRTGENVGTLSLPEPSASLASLAFIDFFGDFDEDGDVDLVDYRRFQRCFTGSLNLGELADECIICDRNGDGYVDAFDFVPFPNGSTGP